VDWHRLRDEKRHKSKLAVQFKPHLLDKKVICLNIPDHYKLTDPALVELRYQAATPFLQQRVDHQVAPVRPTSREIPT
jgi:predicted protein tyrosine phosphatase